MGHKHTLRLHRLSSFQRNSEKYSFHFKLPRVLQKPLRLQRSERIFLLLRLILLVFLKLLPDLSSSTSPSSPSSSSSPWWWSSSSPFGRDYSLAWDSLGTIGVSRHPVEPIISWQQHRHRHHHHCKHLRHHYHQRHHHYHHDHCHHLGLQRVLPAVMVGFWSVMMNWNIMGGHRVKFWTCTFAQCSDVHDN